MTTEKQIMANRENAKKGGVKTEEGKALIKYNAVKHGLLCKEILLPDEDGDILNELSSNISASLQPQGAMEEMLTERIISCVWRMRRAMRVESDVIKSALAHWEIIPHRKPTGNTAWKSVVSGELGNNGAWININRYETAMERQLYKAMHELQRLQAARRGECIPAPVVIDVDVSAQG